MPINRVPVVHKFGIISRTQRADLEKRIAKKAYLETRRKLDAQQPPEARYLYCCVVLFLYDCACFCLLSIEIQIGGVCEILRCLLAIALM